MKTLPEACISGLFFAPWRLPGGLCEGIALLAGADAIKEALAKLGLKTGGTLRQRAERLFLTRDVPLAELDKRHFVKGAAPAGALSVEERDRQEAMMLEAALLEAKVGMARTACHYAGLLSLLSWRPLHDALCTDL